MQNQGSKLVSFLRPIEPQIMPQYTLSFKYLFLTHKVEVALSTKAMGNKSDNLVQGYTSVNDERWSRQGGHVGIHFFVHQPESNGFIPN